jgi:hypothetical protein
MLSNEKPVLREAVDSGQRHSAIFLVRPGNWRTGEASVSKVNRHRESQAFILNRCKLVYQPGAWSGYGTIGSTQQNFLGRSSYRLSWLSKRARPIKRQRAGSDFGALQALQAALAPGA